MMNIKQSVLAAAVMAAVLGMSGCAGTGWSVKGACTGAGCSVEGEIHGGQQKLMANDARDTALAGTTATTSNLSAIDASNVVIDTSGSSVDVPLSGNITLKLLDSTSGFMFAARTFTWTRYGSELHLSNPTQVNAWIQENGSGADDLQYAVAPFAIAEASGLNTFSTAVSYAGETLAASNFTWTGSGGGGCRTCQEK